MSTYLVTGVAGFIASKVAEFLLKEGHHVVGIDNLNDYYDVRLKDYRLGQLLGGSMKMGSDPHVSVNACLGRQAHESFTFEPIDIENRKACEKLFEEFKIDAVVNLAARAGVRYSMENPYVYMTTNAMGTLNLLECMKRFSVKKMVLASTSSLYAGQTMPFSEDLAVNTPLSPYAASKKSAELMAYSYHKLYGMDISVVRYFTVYGPAGRPDMSIFRFIKWIDEGRPMEVFGDGSQSRDFTYVDDIARGSIAAIKQVGYEIINLGGGNNPLSLNEAIRFIEERLEKKAIRETKPFHIADIDATWADISKAGRLLAWSPQVKPMDGFAKCVDWYLENRNWLKNIVL